MLKLPPPEDDGLYIREKVGDWSSDKHHFLMRYIDIFTTAMKGKWELHYIDLFAGAGLERLKLSRELHWGSPLIAAHAPYPFSMIHLCELHRKEHAALKARIEKYAPGARAQVLRGDANARVHEIVDTIPDRRSLSLAFLDPTGLDLDYETLQVLAKKRTDLIIFFPDRLDALRNWKAWYLDNPNSNLDRVLGPGADWRSIRENVPKHRWAEELRKLYVKQIGKLGYAEDQFDYERIYFKEGRPLYLLIFCSRHRTGAKFWRKICTRKPDGQQTWDFDPGS